MSIKSLVVLVLCLAIGAGAFFYSGSKQSINAADKIGQAILPGLKPALNDVTELTISAADNRVLATIVRSSTGWTVTERNGYPADISTVRATLLNLAEASIIEEKTSNAALYAKLGVEAVTEKEAQGVKASVKYADQVVELIVGKPGPQINKTRYVRPASQTASWLVDRKIDLRHEPEYWLKKSIFSVEPDEVDTVTITLADGAVLALANNQDEEKTFSVTNLSDEKSQVVNAELHQITNALSQFQLLDVATAEQFADKTPTMNVRYALLSGLTIDLTTYDVDASHYASVAVSLQSELADDKKAAAQAEREKIKNVTSGWVYKIPNVTYDSMYKREADVLAITEDQLN